MGEPVSFSLSTSSEPEAGFAEATVSCLYFSVVRDAGGWRGRQGGISCWKKWKTINCKGVKERRLAVTKVRSCEGWRGEGKRDQSGSHALKDGEGAKEGESEGDEETEGKRLLLAQTHLQNFSSPLQSVGPFWPLSLVRHQTEFCYHNRIDSKVSTGRKHVLFCLGLWYNKSQFSLDCEQAGNSLLHFC